MSSEPAIVHLLTARDASEDIPRLRAALAAAPGRSRLVVIGDEPVHAALPTPHARLPVRRFESSMRPLPDSLREIEAGGVVHVWSRAALRLAARLAGRGARAVLDFERCAGGAGPGELLRDLHKTDIPHTPAWLRLVCGTVQSATRLVSAGAAREVVTHIPYGGAAIGNAAKAAARQAPDDGASWQVQDDGGARQAAGVGAARQPRDDDAARQGWDGGAPREAPDNGAARQALGVGPARQPREDGAARQPRDGEGWIGVVVSPVYAHRGVAAFQAVWAALILDRARPGGALFIPAVRDEEARFDHLARACQRPGLLRYAPANVDELLAQADVALALQPNGAPLDGAAAALAAGVPLIARRSAASQELAASFSTPSRFADSPVEATREALRILEGTEALRELGAPLPALPGVKQVVSFVMLYGELTA